MQKLFYLALVMAIIFFTTLSCHFSNEESLSYFSYETDSSNIEYIQLSNEINLINDDMVDSSYLIYIQSLNDTNLINYYDKPVVILWRPREEEDIKYLNNRSKDYIESTIDDLIYYTTMAESFLIEEIDKKNIVFSCIVDSNDCCAFIVRGDTMKICKANCTDYSIWCRILFEPSKNPKITYQVDIESDFNEYFGVLKKK
jgi:hypothetical protein